MQPVRLHASKHVVVAPATEVIFRCSDWHPERAFRPLAYLAFELRPLACAGEPRRGR